MMPAICRSGMHADQDIFKGSDIQQIFEESSRAFCYRSFEDSFRESYGAGYRTFEFKQPSTLGRIFVGGLRSGQNAGESAPLVGYLEKLIRYEFKKKWGFELPEKDRVWNDFIELVPEQDQIGVKIKYICRKIGRELFVIIPPNTTLGSNCV